MWHGQQAELAAHSSARRRYVDIELYIVRKRAAQTDLRENRRQYYSVLAQADRGRPAALINFVARAVERSLNLYLDAAIPRDAPPAVADTWIPLRQAAQGTPYSQEYLSLLARTGRLEAIKRARVWYTTSRALDAYRESLRDK